MNRTTVTFNVETQKRYADLKLKTPFGKKVQEVFNLFLEKMEIEKDYGIDLTRRACNRYYLRRGNELKLKREIAEREEELKQMKEQAKK